MCVEYTFLQHVFALGMGPVLVLEQFPMDFAITRSAAMLDKPVGYWNMYGMLAEFNSNGTLEPAVALRFTLELMSCLKQPTQHYIQIWKIFTSRDSPQLILVLRQSQTIYPN